ncbi:PfkB family carbohydrate kinase [Pseudonocardia kujensis]|uniref:PfkB family carbohydrate kinase n=1 Tax=Pseudonocardia kujensis TaxID=1128675 RepID=UPI001E349EC8|nr:PfkB family carbohydrate kinase [Pseudonocardia kujensis]MCE0761708.1 PfkB family carbohydrate kinase [Pseudonocardia kujensis]
MTGRLVHTGQVVIDLVMRVPALPPAGGDVLASDTSTHAGGGFNVMAAAARSGASVLYTGGHGRGPHGDLTRAALAAEGIAVAQPMAEQDTGVCVVLVDDTGERTFVTGSGAETAVAGALPAVSAADVVYVSGYSLLVPAKAEQILALSGGAVLVDPGPLAAEIEPGLWARMLSRTCVLSCNAREARLLSGEPDPARAGLALGRRLRDEAVVLVRDGAAGCLLVRGGEVEHVPGVRVEAVDTNGAGDAHCGVLAAELLRGATVPEAARRANAAAALAVTRPGPATAPTRAELDAFLTTHPTPT